MTDKSKRFVIFDIDGTLFNCDHRHDLAQSGKWDEFHEASDADEPYDDIVHLAAIFNHISYNVIALTGRNERYRTRTIDKMLRHCIYVDELLMRPDDDFSKDIEFKIAALEKRFGTKELVLANVLFVMEDRDRVVSGLRAYGLTVLQPREGAY